MSDIGGIRSVSPELDSICGDDWFILEGSRWLCAQRHPDHSLAITDFGDINSVIAGSVLVRGPDGADSRHIGRSLDVLYAFDPSTLATSTLGSLPAHSGHTSRLLDFEGDGDQDLLLASLGTSPGTIVSFDSNGGQVNLLQTIAVAPFSSEVRLFGQFDADPQVELASNTIPMRFLDALTNSVEGYEVAENISSVPEPIVADFDADGKDEIVALTCCGDTQLKLIQPGAATTAAFNLNPQFGILRSLLAVQWTSVGPPHLAVVQSEGISVVSLTTASVVAQFPLADPIPPHPTLSVLDWTEDGIEDIYWLVGSRMQLLVKGQGVLTPQEFSVRKRSAGATSWQGLPSLAFVETSDSSRLVYRDALSLQRQAEFPLGLAVSFGATLSLVDAHSTAGMELLVADENAVQLFSAEGQLLWEHRADLLRTFMNTTSAAGCTPPNCLVYLLDGSSNQQDRVLKTLSAQDGSIVRATPAPGNGAFTRKLLAALQDTTGGEDLLLLALGNDLLLLDSVDHTEVWRTSFERQIHSARRMEQHAAVILAIDQFSTLSLVDLDDGTILRSRGPRDDISSNCFDPCSAVNLTTETGHMLMLANSSGYLQLLDASLRGPIALFDEPGRLPVSALTGIFSLPDGLEIRSVHTTPEVVFVDDMEAW
ncbi:MAG: hypothetical protein KDI37_02560 [Xanthomonadales bacterium]|nr:hypothetical protein [Xanthomonadales bacterium]